VAIKRMRKQCVPGALFPPSSAPGNEANLPGSLPVFLERSLGTMYFRMGPEDSTYIALFPGSPHIQRAW